MTYKTFYLIIFGLFTAYGGFRMVAAMRKMRTRRDYQGAILTWTERPSPAFRLSGLKYEGGARASVVIHGLSMAAIGLAVGLALFLRPMRPVLEWEMPGLFVIPGLAMMIAIVGYFWGTALFHPLAEQLGGDRHFAVSAEGILYIGQLMPWSAFRRFSLTTDGSAAQLWSASFPGLIGVVLSPPPEQMTALLELLRMHLPGEPGEASGGFLAQCLFPGLVVAICAPMVAAAWLAVLSTAELAVMIGGFLMALLVILGGPGLSWLAYRRKVRPAPVEGKETSGDL